MSKLTKLKGDASFRSFFRKKENGNSTIVVYAKKEKFKNLLVYDAINKIFKKNKILAPKLYSQKYNKNLIEIEDFGDQTIFKILKKKSSNKLRYFKQIIKLLIQIQSIKSRKVKNFRNRNYSIPKYKKNILINEANLFCDWYVKKNLSKSRGKKFSKNFRKIVKNLTFGLKLKDDILVHRDFHVSNLILVNNQIGIIDSQDALIGNRAYDLASLIDDVRLKTSISIKKKILNLYLKKQKKIDIKKFINDFEILSILRNLKIIGIFTRLAVRDGKKNYLKLIPYAWELINMRIHQNHAFIDLRNLLTQNFKKKIK